MDEAEDLPAVDQARLERLLRWHEGIARRDGSLALSLEAEGLEEAARRNRLRAEAHRETVQLLSRLRPAQTGPATAFRGHLPTAPKARIRAPP
ncbi:MAG: hypothetical protein WAP03_18745 [Methylorubrum rhodinum]|uniref:hypothetical protein n=1 Tax=Methylorubrum rhodinum TaxID=29428 RepID=UPI003BB0BEE4